MALDDINIQTLFLREANQFPRLSSLEEVELAKKREQGELARVELAIGVKSPERKKELENSVLEGALASEKLTNCNLRLVISIARKYRGRGVPEQDLWQEGSLGLQTGISQYNWRRGFRFSTYVYWWIRKFIAAAIPEQSRSIRIPAHIYADITKIMQASRKIEQQAGIASSRAISEETGIDIDRVAELMITARHPDYLSLLVNREDGSTGNSTLESTIADDGVDVYKKVEDSILGEILLSAIDIELNDIEKKIIYLRYGFVDGAKHSLPEIGRELGMPREQVHKIELDAVKKLKAFPKLAGLSAK